MFICMQVCRFTYMHISRGQRTIIVVPQTLPGLVLTKQIRLADGEPQWSICLYLPNAKIISTLPWLVFFYMDSRGSNSGFCKHFIKWSVPRPYNSILTVELNSTVKIKGNLSHLPVSLRIFFFMHITSVNIRYSYYKYHYESSIYKSCSNFSRSTLKSLEINHRNRTSYMTDIFNVYILNMPMQVHFQVDLMG